VRGP